MGQTAIDLHQELQKIESEIAASEKFDEISDLNLRAMDLKRELGLPLDN